MKKPWPAENSITASGSKAKSKALKKPSRPKTRQSPGVQQSRTLDSEYVVILDSLTQVIRDARRRAAASVNREPVCLYWHLGRVIVGQQENAQWGDAVVEKLSADLRSRFPDMKGLTKANLFRMRKFVLACSELDNWLPSFESGRSHSTSAGKVFLKVGAAPPQFPDSGLGNAGLTPEEKVPPSSQKVGTLSLQIQYPRLLEKRFFELHNFVIRDQTCHAASVKCVDESRGMIWPPSPDGGGREAGDQLPILRCMWLGGMP